MTIYRKLDIKESPKKEGNFHVIFFGGTDHESIATVQYNHFYGFHEEMTDCTGITHWLEEIELPSENEIANKIEELQEKHYESQATHGDFYLMGEDCIEYILNKITNTK